MTLTNSDGDKRMHRLEVQMMKLAVMASFLFFLTSCLYCLKQTIENNDIAGYVNNIRCANDSKTLCEKSSLC